MEIDEILQLKFEAFVLDHKEVTVRGFFYELMVEVLTEDGSKNIFGDSVWDYDLIKCLIENNVIEGTVDRDGEIDYNRESTDKYILDHIIKGIFN